CLVRSARAPSPRTRHVRTATCSAAARSSRSRRSAPRHRPVRIAVDAMGGDHAPDEIVRGALLYREQGGTADVVLVGQEERLRPLLGGAHAGIEIRHAAEASPMAENPGNAR